MSSGERPIGAARGKQTETEALCQTPLPPPMVVGRSNGRLRGHNTIHGGYLGFGPDTKPPPPNPLTLWALCVGGGGDVGVTEPGHPP